MLKFSNVGPVGGADEDDYTQLLTQINVNDDLVNQRKPLDFGEVDDKIDDFEDDNLVYTVNYRSSNEVGNKKKKSGGFQSFDLPDTLLQAIRRKGYTVPTPIQRKTIPWIMAHKDLVAMARTGSGKTAAFVLPMIAKLRQHSATYGCRSLIISPSRELALQTLKFVREMSRGTDLRSLLLVGGDNMEEQFSEMLSNPDIIVTTPGRFVHLMVEMRLELSSVKYIVFDEADRLFEMGFSVQIGQILESLPANRQTLLFSATLPDTLVQFSRASLQDPRLIRLDVDSQISPDLRSAFFTLRSDDREGALLYIIERIIGIPTGSTPANERLKQQINESSEQLDTVEKKIREDEEIPISKRRKIQRGKKLTKRKHELIKLSRENIQNVSKHSTIIFVSTKHAVEYIAALLLEFDYAVSWVYGSMDQAARRIQVNKFRAGLTNILVVTDVGARGIDIPLLANVINYGFPSEQKLFLHRVGRTARAGRTGWSYNLINEADLPYLLDLQVYLGRKLIVGCGRNDKGEKIRVMKDEALTRDIVIGGLPEYEVGMMSEHVNNIVSLKEDLRSQKEVYKKGERMFIRTRSGASGESVRRCKEMISQGSIYEEHIMFEKKNEQEDLPNIHDKTRQREEFLDHLRKFKPEQTIFECLQRDTSHVTMVAQRLRARKTGRSLADDGLNGLRQHRREGRAEGEGEAEGVSEQGSEEGSELKVSGWVRDCQVKGKKSSQASWIDHDNCLGYESGKGNGWNEKSVAVPGDEWSHDAEAHRVNVNRKVYRWDRKAKKYSMHDSPGRAKMMKGESGVLLPASYNSGRFAAWKSRMRIDRMSEQTQHITKVGKRRHIHTGSVAKCMGTGTDKYIACKGKNIRAGTGSTKASKAGLNGTRHGKITN